MLTIRKATTADCELIHKLAWQMKIMEREWQKP